MNNSYKTLSLFIAIATILPVYALDHNDVKPGDVVPIIANNATIEAGDVIGTVGGPITQVTPEKEEIKNESTFQRICNFVSNNKANIACGLLSAFFLYRLVYVTIPEFYRLEELRKQDQEMIASLRELVDLMKTLPKQS